MQPNYSSVGQLFSAQTRYTVPLFQRPYVWIKEEQWEPLWDDVQALADRVLDPPLHKPVAGHFLGTVVLEQLKTAAIAMPQRQVIDGQQRLTTLQILLKAAEHALETAGGYAAAEAAIDFKRAAGQVGQLCKNAFAAQAEETYKVWPTNDDRESFRAVMDCAASTGVGQQQTLMADAYRYFRKEALAWLGGSEPQRRATAFASALSDHLRLVVLDLDENDEPRAIFETLNAHGTPLLPADLMKNWLLWQAQRQNIRPETLYQSYWSQFDREHQYWRKNVGTGHAARPRVDTFLQNWLTVATVDAVPVKHLYDRFLAYANQRALARIDGNLDVQELMEEIQSYALLYERLSDPPGGGQFDRVLERLNRLDYVVFRPVIMALLGRAGSDESDQLRASTALESFIVRRVVCEMQTRGYGTLALDLVKAVRDQPETGFATDAVVEVLRTAAGGWPDDDAFKQSWSSRRFYGALRRDRVAMILQAIEERYQSEASMAEPVLKFDYSRLTVEHVMPQSWAAHWPLPPGVDVTERDTLVQNIGNLTLVSGKLNPTLSNSPWHRDVPQECKRSGLSAHSDLKLNKRLLAESGMVWDHNSIMRRAEVLFDAAKEIWPSPERFRAQD